MTRPYWHIADVMSCLVGGVLFGRTRKENIYKHFISGVITVCTLKQLGLRALFKHTSVVVKGKGASAAGPVYKICIKLL